MFLDGEPVAATLLSTLCGTFGHRHHSLDETRAGDCDEMVSVCAVLLIWSFHPDVSENAPYQGSTVVQLLPGRMEMPLVAPLHQGVSSRLLLPGL